MVVRPASDEWYDGEGDTIVVHLNGWEMICPEELARIHAILKMISEIQ